MLSIGSLCDLLTCHQGVFFSRTRYEEISLSLFHRRLDSSVAGEPSYAAGSGVFDKIKIDDVVDQMVVNMVENSPKWDKVRPQGFPGFINS